MGLDTSVSVRVTRGTSAFTVIAQVKGKAQRARTVSQPWCLLNEEAIQGVDAVRLVGPSERSVKEDCHVRAVLGHVQIAKPTGATSPEVGPLIIPQSSKPHAPLLFEVCIL